MNERLSLSAFIITFGQKRSKILFDLFLMYILPNKTHEIFDISYIYKEEYIYIITNSLYALIFP